MLKFERRALFRTVSSFIYLIIFITEGILERRGSLVSAGSVGRFRSYAPIRRGLRCRDDIQVANSHNYIAAAFKIFHHYLLCFSFLKLVHIFSVNPHLGPLQISLGRMIIDIIKFFFIYTLVLFAFGCGE